MIPVTFTGPVAAVPPSAASPDAPAATGGVFAALFGAMLAGDKAAPDAAPTHPQGGDGAGIAALLRNAAISTGHPAILPDAGSAGPPFAAPSVPAEALPAPSLPPGPPTPDDSSDDATAPLPPALAALAMPPAAGGSESDAAPADRPLGGGKTSAGEPSPRGGGAAVPVPSPAAIMAAGGTEAQEPIAKAAPLAIHENSGPVGPAHDAPRAHGASPLLPPPTAAEPPPAASRALQGTAALPFTPPASPADPPRPAASSGIEGPAATEGVAIRPAGSAGPATQAAAGLIADPAPQKAKPAIPPASPGPAAPLSAGPTPSPPLDPGAIEADLSVRRQTSATPAWSPVTAPSPPRPRAGPSLGGPPPPHAAGSSIISELSETTPGAGPPPANAAAAKAPAPAASAASAPTAAPAPARAEATPITGTSGNITAEPLALPLAAGDTAPAVRTIPLSNLAALPHAAITAISAMIASEAAAGTSRFHIRLDPPELGRIDVRLRFTRDGELHARLIADRPETVSLLVRDSGALERALQAAGMKTSDSGIDVLLRDPSGGFARNDGGLNGDTPASPLHHAPPAMHGDPPPPDLPTPWMRSLAANRLDLTV